VRHPMGARLPGQDGNGFPRPGVGARTRTVQLNAEIGVTWPEEEGLLGSVGRGGLISERRNMQEHGITG
jgi:hypothetical protein